MSRILLPLVDEHTVEVPASTEEVWAVLRTIVDGAFRGSVSSAYARIVGCVPASAGGPRPIADGSTIVGFRVTSAEPPRRLVLTGRHRFSSYQLTFTADELESRRTRLTAATHAAFPGVGGRLYRALVIESGVHARMVRQLLSSIEREVDARARPGKGASSR